MKGWLSKDKMVSFHSFTVNQERDFFSPSSLRSDVHIYIYIYTSRWMHMCANIYPSAAKGNVFPISVTYQHVRASGFKQKASPGPRPLESSACEGQVWFRKRQGRLAWKWNLLSLCQTLRLTDCPQPLITSKSILSSHRPLLLPVWPALHTNIRITQWRSRSEMGLFNDHDVKQCLCEKETWIQLFAAAETICFKKNCLFSLLF